MAFEVNELITSARISSMIIYVLLAWRVIFMWCEPRTPDWAARATPWWIAMLLLWCACVVGFFSPEHIMRANDMSVSLIVRQWMQLGGIFLVNMSGLCGIIALAISRGRTGIESISVAAIPLSFFLVSIIL